MLSPQLDMHRSHALLSIVQECVYVSKGKRGCDREGPPRGAYGVSCTYVIAPVVVLLKTSVHAWQPHGYTKAGT